MKGAAGKGEPPDNNGKSSGAPTASVTGKEKPLAKEDITQSLISLQKTQDDVNLPDERSQLSEFSPKNSNVSLTKQESYSKLPLLKLSELMNDKNNPKKSADENGNPKKGDFESPNAGLQNVKYYDQEQFDKKYGYRRVDLSLAKRIKYHFKRVGQWKLADWIIFLKWRFPISRWLPSYSWRKDLLPDIIGGLMVAIMCVPQGLAYGYLVGVPPIYGLYTGIVGPLIYVIFGTSKHVSPGSFAIVSLMVGTVVQEISQNPGGLPMPITEANVSTTICCAQDIPAVDPQMAVGIATSVTLLVGVFQLVFGLLNAGILAVWLSDHLVQGLTSGAAIHVLTSQIKAMTGISNLPSTAESFGLIKFYICFFNQIETVKLNILACSTICIFLLMVSTYLIDPTIKKWLKAKFPMELFLIVFSTLLTGFSKSTDYDVRLPHVGPVASGMEPPKLPPMHNAAQMIGPSISIAIISFVIHISLAKLVSKKLHYEIDSNQEWFALGAMHSTSCFFGCFAGGSSLGRTMTQVKFETRSQVSTLVCVATILIVVFLAAPLIEFLPKSVLACIVAYSMKDLYLQIFSAPKLLKQSVVDFLIFLVTFSAVIVLNVNLGMIVGIVFALLSVVFRTQWAESTMMGRIPGTFDFKGLGHYSSAEEVPGIKVFRFDAPLYFANAETFILAIYKATGLNPVLLKAKVAEQKAQGEKKRLKKKQSEVNLVQKGEMVPLNAAAEQENQIQLRVKSAKDVKVEKDDERKEPVEHGNTEESVQLTHLVIDCSSIPFVDLMGKDALAQVYIDYAGIDITVLFAHCKVAVRQFFETCDWYQKVPKNRMFVSIVNAVTQAQLEQKIPYIERNGSRMVADERTKISGPNVPVAKSPPKAKSLMVGPTVISSNKSKEKDKLEKSLAKTQLFEDEKKSVKEQTATVGEETATDYSDHQKRRPLVGKRPLKPPQAQPKTKRSKEKREGGSVVQVTQEYFADEEQTQ